MIKLKNINLKVLGEESDPQALFDESLVKIGPPADIEVTQVGVSQYCNIPEIILIFISGC